jgi:hypothetical protein
MKSKQHYTNNICHILVYVLIIANRLQVNQTHSVAIADHQYIWILPTLISWLRLQAKDSTGSGK